MKAVTYEATVEGGQIRLPDAVRLPDHTKVYVLVPGIQESLALRMHTPRLAHPEQARDFVKEVSTER